MTDGARPAKLADKSFQRLWLGRQMRVGEGAFAVGIYLAARLARASSGQEPLRAARPGAP